MHVKYVEFNAINQRTFLRLRVEQPILEEIEPHHFILKNNILLAAVETINKTNPSFTKVHKANSYL